MRTEFSAAIDPIFVQVIEAIDSLTKGDEPDPNRLQDRVADSIHRADAILGTDPQWDLAKYAMVAWIDERFVLHPWQGSRWWSNNVLEVRMFNSRICNTQFFELAKQAAAFPRRDALCVFHNCVLLGFRGLYATQGADHLDNASTADEIGNSVRRLTTQMNLPPTLNAWVQMVDSMIEQEPAPAAPPATIRRITGAPPSRGRQQLVWASIAAALIVAFNLAIARL